MSLQSNLEIFIFLCCINKVEQPWKAIVPCTEPIALEIIENKFRCLIIFLLNKLLLHSSGFMDSQDISKQLLDGPALPMCPQYGAEQV